MKAMTGVVAAVLGSGLISCTAMDEGTNPYGGGSPADGVACGVADARGPVYIDIRYAGDGMPSAVPERCTVEVGTDITWCGPADPVRDRVPRRTRSAARCRGHADGSGGRRGRYKIRLNASNQPGEYKYGIRARGKELDPAIIIRQR